MRSLPSPQPSGQRLVSSPPLLRPQVRCPEEGCPPVETVLTDLSVKMPRPGAGARAQNERRELSGLGRGEKGGEREDAKGREEVTKK